MQGVARRRRPILAQALAGWLPPSLPSQFLVSWPDTGLHDSLSSLINYPAPDSCPELPSQAECQGHHHFCGGEASRGETEAWGSGAGRRVLSAVTGDLAPALARGVLFAISDLSRT